MKRTWKKLIGGISPAKIFGRPTADRIWLGSAQRRALAFLETPTPGITKLILGPHSCGKSIVLDRYLADLQDRIVIFRSRDGWHSPSELLIALLESANLSPATHSDTDRREQFRSYLSEQRDLGNDVLFVIDDAEQLTPSVWLEFYRLSTLVCDDGYSPELLIAGQPQAYEYLKSPMARGWNTCLFAVHRLPRLKPLDVRVYVEERLKSAGLPKTVFSHSARVLTGQLAGGSFTTANLLCQMALVMARQRSETFVGKKLVSSAYASLVRDQFLQVAEGRPLP